MDLFENYELQPENLSKICKKWSLKHEKKPLGYKGLKKFLKDVESIGFTFDYGMDASPYDLRKI